MNDAQDKSSGPVVTKPECPYCHDTAYSRNGGCGCWCHKTRTIIRWRLTEREFFGA